MKNIAKQIIDAINNTSNDYDAEEAIEEILKTNTKKPRTTFITKDGEIINNDLQN